MPRISKRVLEVVAIVMVVAVVAFVAGAYWRSQSPLPYGAPPPGTAMASGQLVSVAGQQIVVRIMGDNNKPEDKTFTVPAGVSALVAYPAQPVALSAVPAGSNVSVISHDGTIVAVQVLATSTPH